MSLFKSILWSLAFMCTTLGLSAQQNAEISADVDLKDAAEVVVEPFTNFSFYTIARAALDGKGKAVLRINTKVPFMAALKVKTATGKPLCTVSVYVEPGDKLGVSIVKKGGELNPNVVFQGKLSAENEVLKKFKLGVLRLSISKADPDETLRQVEEELNKQSYSSGFKDYVMKSIGLLAQMKSLPGLQRDTDAYRKSLQKLLGDLKTEVCWQSVPQWPGVFDDFFVQCEEEKLIPVAGDGLSNRLRYIGDETLRNRYAVFVLKRVVNSRTWFDNSPTGVIESLKPYLTTGEAKQELEGIVAKFESMEKSWAHLRHQQAFDFNFEDVNGKRVKLSDYRGKFVLLDVWNVYCGPCMKQVPYLQKLEPELEKMNVVVIGVSSDPQDIKDKWKNTVREKQMAGIQVIMDNEQRSKFMKGYVVALFPTFCLIGPDGMVINPALMKPETPDFMKEIQKRVDHYNENHLGLSAQQKAEISVDVDLPDAAEIEVKPFTNFPCYTIAQAALDGTGKAVLQIDTKVPFMAALKVNTAEGRPLYTVSLYVEPGTKLETIITKKEGVRNPNITFRGKLSKENEVLENVMPTDFKLGVSSANPDVTLRQVEEELNKQICSSEFKNYVLKSVGLLVEVKKLPGLQNDTEAYRKALRELLNGLKKEDYWQSIPQWPNELDNFFARCEAEQLIPTAEDGLSNRLQCIGDENIRNRYALYCLERLVNFRTWYENPPVKIIESLKPYLTTGEAKQKLEGIVKQFEHLEKSWGHLRHQLAPDFNFEDVNGKMVKLSDYRGKFVLLDVWNIYCGPCMNQVPYLQKLEPELEKMNVVVIGVSCDPQDIKDKWKNTVHRKQMPGVQVIMDKGRKSKFMSDYAIMGFPTFCLIGPDGVVINPSFKRPEMPDFMRQVQKRMENYNGHH